jgi:hypothetical protein
MSAYLTLYNYVFDELEKSIIIKTVDDYNEQYNHAEEYNLVNYPAVYIETGEVNWEKNQNNFYEYAKSPQIGTADIIIHIVYHTLDKYDRKNKNKFFNIVDGVSNLLQKLECSPNDIGTFSTLLRIKEQYITPSKQLRVAKLTFETKLTDNFYDYDVEEVTGITFQLNTQIIEFPYTYQLDASGNTMKDVNGNYILVSEVDMMKDINLDILVDDLGHIIYDYDVPWDAQKDYLPPAIQIDEFGNVL